MGSYFNFTIHMYSIFFFRVIYCGIHTCACVLFYHGAAYVLRSVHIHACIHVSTMFRCVLPLTPVGSVCTYGHASRTHRVCVFMCVNALTTCPDGEVETFVHSALKEFAWWGNFSTAVKVKGSLTFWCHSVPWLSQMDISPPLQKSDAFFISAPARMRFWRSAEYFFIIIIIMIIIFN